MLPKIRNTAEEIPKRFDISNTTKHSSFGRSLLGKKNTYALFIKDINKIHVEENDLINQGYNYPQIEEIEPK